MNFEVIDGLDVFNQVPNWRLHMAHLSLAPDYSDQVLDVAVKGVKTRVRKRFEKASWEDEPTLCALREALGPDQPATSERLAREILDGGEFPRAKHPGVEFRDLLALRTMLPWSVMDARQVLFPMQYRLGKAGETGEQRGEEVALEGLPVLADGRGVVASPCCCHDLARMTDDAQEVILVCYTPMSIAQAFTARTELGRLMWMTWVFKFECEKAFKPPQ
jgi:DNA/RNA-binding domain of Phe-tRNA-synthetase-like protein